MDGNGLNIFDYIDEMKKAGMPHEQADVLGKALGKVASEGAATKHDLEFAKLELKKDIEGINLKIEGVNLKIEGVRAELKRDIKSLEDRIGMKMVITSGSFAFLILGSLVTLAKLGLLSPTG